MRGMAPDNDVIGHFRIIQGHLVSPRWLEEWEYLKLTLHSLDSLGLAPTATDRLVWQACQAAEIVLITGNRNDDGPDSLAATLRDSNTPSSLPVMTLANLDRVRNDPAYVERVVERLLEYLFDIENYRGTGRLYLP